jgi:hypothetical protein
MSIEAARERRATAARAVEVERLEVERARLQSRVEELIISKAAPVEGVRAERSGVIARPVAQCWRKLQRGLLRFAVLQRKKVRSILRASCLL